MGWQSLEAFLWLRAESRHDKSVAVTFVCESEVAKGLVTEFWALQLHLRLVASLRDLYVEACDSRLVTWIHVRSHGRESDPAKQHLLPHNERADRLAEQGCCGELLPVWVYTIQVDEPELSVEQCRWCCRISSTLARLVFMRQGVGLSRRLNVANAGCGCPGILIGLNAWLMSNIVWARRSQT